MYSGDVRYFDGSVTLSTTDIAPADLGLISGQTRTWTDEPGVATSSLNGNNVVVSQWPSIIQESGGSILAVSSGQTTRPGSIQAVARPSPNDFTVRIRWLQMAAAATF